MTSNVLDRHMFLRRLLSEQGYAEYAGPMTAEVAARIDRLLTDAEAGMPVTLLADRALNDDGSIADEQAFEQLRAAVR